MRNILFAVLVLAGSLAYAQEIVDHENNDDVDFGTAGGITVYGERREEFEPGSAEAEVLNQLNGNAWDRKRFIETNLLEKAGFRRSGNAKYRKTNASEKTLSVLHDMARGFSLGLAPVSKKPLLEIEYGRLPKGEYYRFESVIVNSGLQNVTPEVLTLIELEYMLQIEFCNGTLIQDTLKYYTDANIDKFEDLVLQLPEHPESINRAKKRYANELRRIKAALERYNNPSENYLRALQNLNIK